MGAARAEGRGRRTRRAADLVEVYHRLRAALGPQPDWWPARSSWEVVLGALLAQRTNWRNVGPVIEALRARGLLAPPRLAAADVEALAPLLRGVGLQRQRARRLVGLARALVGGYGGDPDRLLGLPEEQLRAQLLAWEGIGPETADAILLYASDKATFVVDAYTERILRRLGHGPWRGYGALKAYVEARLPRDLGLFREFHALLDELGGRWCRPTPRCAPCPLVDLCPTGRRAVGRRR